MARNGEEIHPNNSLPIVTLATSGASFPQTIMRAWAALANESTQGALSFYYPAGGSGRGASDFLAGVNDFSCSDAPLTAAQQMNATKNGERTVLHLPETLGAVVFAAKFPNNLGKFYLTPELGAMIYTGQITRWNDSRILAVNGQQYASFFAERDNAIKVIRRSDSSGTTFAFTDFLRKTAPGIWTTGAQNAPTFTFWANRTTGCPGNTGVINCLLNTTWGIAYIESGQAIALGANVSIASVLDASCVFTDISFAAVSAAVGSSFFVPPPRNAPWAGVSIAGIEGGNLWPISTFSYVFVQKNQLGRGPRGAATKAFLEYIHTREAQLVAIDWGFVPLSEKFAADNIVAIREIEVDNETLYSLYLKALLPPPREIKRIQLTNPSQENSVGGKRGGSIPFVFSALAVLWQYAKSAWAATCAGAFNRCPITTPRDLVKIYTYNPLESAQFAPFWTAQRMGAFDAQCVATELYPSNSGAADVVDKVADGTYQLGVTTMQALLSAQKDGKSVYGLAQISKRSSWLLLAHKKPHPQGLTAANVQQLKGKVIWQSPESAALPYLRANGLNALDVSYQKQGTGELVAADFLKPGAMASALEVRPHVELAAILTTPKNPNNPNSPLWQLSDFFVFEFNSPNVRWPDDVLIVNQNFYNTKKPIVTRALAAITAGFVFCRSAATACASASPISTTTRWPRVLAVDKYMDTVFDIETLFGEPRDDALRAYAANLAYSNLQVSSEVSAVFAPGFDAVINNARALANISDTRAADGHVSTLLPFCFFTLTAGPTAAPCGTQFDEINFVKPTPQPPAIEYIPAPTVVQTLSDGIIAAIVIGCIAAVAAIIGSIVFVYLRGQRSLAEQTKRLATANAELEMKLKETSNMTGDALKMVLSTYNEASEETKEQMVHFRDKKLWRPADDSFESVEPDAFPLTCSTTRLTFGLAGQVGRLVTATVGQKLEHSFSLKNNSGEALNWSIVSAPPNFLYALSFAPDSGTLAKGQEITINGTLVPFATKKIRTAISIVVPSQNKFLEVKATADVGIGPLLDPAELQLAEEPVSQGAAGSIYEGMWRGQHVAVKQFKNQQQLISDLESKANDTLWAEFMLEVQMLSRLRHKKVVGYVGAVIVPRHMCIVTEWIPLGSLHTAVYSFSINVGLKAKLVLDACEALLYCHTNSIIHRDIKPSNVLIESFAPNVAVNAKLADFGSSREESAEDLVLNVITENDNRSATDDYTRGVGTPVYMAPEILDGRRYTTAADIYSFGLLVYSTFLEVTPWYKERRAWDVAAKVKKGKRPPLPADGQLRLDDDSEESRSETSTLPLPVRALIVACWNQEPEKRPTAQAACDDVSRWVDGELPPPVAAVLREGSRMPTSMFVTSGGGTRRSKMTNTGSISDEPDDPLTNTSG